MKKNLLLILSIFVLFSLFTRSCGSNTTLDANLTASDLGIGTTKTEYAYGKGVQVTIQNNLTETVTIENECPAEPLDVFKYKDGEWVQTTAVYEDLDCNSEDYTIAPGEKLSLSYLSWSYGVFDEIGRYQIRYIYGNTTYSSNEFTIVEPGMITKIWREAFYRPIYNVLIFLMDTLPGHSLALGIILITLLIRTILLVPSQHAIKSQRKMQNIQPKLEEIKKKYTGNQEKIAMETMKVWQENKVNPMGSCLPLLVQFPIMIALFYAVKYGLNPDQVAYLYGFQQDFAISNINTGFLGVFDLTKIDIYVFPITIGILQFAQMKLAMARKKDKKVETKPAKKDDNKQGMAGDMEQANKMMTYMMPAMIAFFTASVPSGVGLYWGTSTLYGIIQQLFANRDSKASEPKVKVIDKNS